LVKSLELNKIKKDEFKDVGLVMVIGFFDGVHRGHQEIICSCIRKARETGGTSIALTFDWPPVNIIKKKIHKRLILSYEEKIEIIKAMNIDLIVTAHIERSFLELDPEQFCERILVGLFNIRELYIGKGFRFGKDAAGDISFLKWYLRERPIKINEVALVKNNDEVISSTVIRKYYSKGDIKRIKQLLGRDPYLKGKVISGKGRGKKLGIPTVNIGASENLVMPKDGVYLGIVSEKEGLIEKMPAVINIGDNPTFKDKIKRVESHIIDYEGDLYKKIIKVEFLERLREEIKFESIEDLKVQLEKDLRKARIYFGHRSDRPIRH